MSEDAARRNREAAVSVERKTACAILYFDMQGFTRALDELDRSERAEQNLRAFFEAWGDFRNLLIRPREMAFRYNYYLANRIGDAFVVFSFVERAESWFVFATHYVPAVFDEFRAAVRAFYPDFRSHLKTAIYTTADGVVPYFQTAPIPDEVMGKATIARRDFISSGINVCARIDGLDEADRYVFLCNRPVQERLARAYAESSSLLADFVDLGERELRGLSQPERIFGYRELDS